MKFITCNYFIKISFWVKKIFFILQGNTEEIKQLKKKRSFRSYKLVYNRQGWYGQIAKHRFFVAWNGMKMICFKTVF